MTFRIFSGATAAALAGLAFAVISTTPSSAFTLSGQGLDQPFAASNVERAWWDHWGRWHPDCWINGWGVRVCGPGPGPLPMMGPGPGPVPMMGPGPGPGPWMGPHCWWDRWGNRHCR